MDQPEPSLPLVAPPGWYADPEDTSIQRWWDGYAWTGRVVRRVDGRRTLKVIGLSVVGVLIVVWGGIILVQSPAWSGRTASGELVCSPEVQRRGDAGVGFPEILWLLWPMLLLVVLKLVGIARSDGWRKVLVRWLTILGIVTVSVTCPLWEWIASVANCAL